MKTAIELFKESVETIKKEYGDSFCVGDALRLTELSMQTDIEMARLERHRELDESRRRDMAAGSIPRDEQEAPAAFRRMPSDAHEMGSKPRS